MRIPDHKRYVIAMSQPLAGSAGFRAVRLIFSVALRNKILYNKNNIVIFYPSDGAGGIFSGRRGGRLLL